MRALSVVTAMIGIGISVCLAPPAAASQASYLGVLQPKLSFLTGDQLLTEGYKVCRYLSVGRPAGDAIPMVMKDLGVTVSAAFDIVPAAVEELDC